MTHKIIVSLKDDLAAEIGCSQEKLRKKSKLSKAFQAEKYEAALAGNAGYDVVVDHGTHAEVVKTVECWVYQGTFDQIMKIMISEYPKEGITFWKSDVNPGYYEMEV